jgi:hypothetical protein
VAVILVDDPPNGDLAYMHSATCGHGQSATSINLNQGHFSNTP